MLPYGGRKTHGVKPVAVRIAAFVRASCEEAAGPPPPRFAWFQLWFASSCPLREHPPQQRALPRHLLADHEERRRHAEPVERRQERPRVRRRAVVVGQRDLLAARPVIDLPGAVPRAAGDDRAPDAARRTCPLPRGARERHGRLRAVCGCVGVPPPVCGVGVAPPVCAADASAHAAGVATTDQRSAPGCSPSACGATRTTSVPARGCPTVPSTARRPRRSTQRPAPRSTHSGAGRRASRRGGPCRRRAAPDRSATRERTVRTRSRSTWPSATLRRSSGEPSAASVVRGAAGARARRRRRAGGARASATTTGTSARRMTITRTRMGAGTDGPSRRRSGPRTSADVTFLRSTTKTSAAFAGIVGGEPVVAVGQIRAG